jgi:putative Holliday junction resolvase
MSGVVLALDVGTRRIGLAVSDREGRLALPLGVVERRSLREDLERIGEYARQYEATELVIGDPVTLRGERAVASEKMDRFVERLQAIVGLPIHRIDERLTTAQATRTLIAAGMRRAERKEHVDALAAALILETFLARRERRS